MHRLLSDGLGALWRGEGFWWLGSSPALLEVYACSEEPSPSVPLHYVQNPGHEANHAQACLFLCGQQGPSQSAQMLASRSWDCICGKVAWCCRYAYLLPSLLLVL